MSEFLYVVEFDSGLIKVGRGANAKARIKAAENIGIVAGWEKINEFSVQCSGGSSKAEGELIAFARQNSKQSRAKEWFVGADFVRLTEKASELALKDYGGSRKRITADDFLERLLGCSFSPKEAPVAIDQEKLGQCMQMADELHEIVSDFGGVVLQNDDHGFNGNGAGYKAAYALYFYQTNDIDVLQQCWKIEDDPDQTVNVEAALNHFHWLVSDKGLMVSQEWVNAWAELKAYVELRVAAEA